VVAEGQAEAVDELVKWCHAGPASARVTGVEIRSEAPEGLTGFSVR
jgi:acylphosphatase